MGYPKFLNIAKAKGFSWIDAGEPKSPEVINIETHEVPCFEGIFYTYNSNKFIEELVVTFSYKGQMHEYRHLIMKGAPNQYPLKAGLIQFLREYLVLHEYVISHFIKEIEQYLANSQQPLLNTLQGNSLAPTPEDPEEQLEIANISKSLPGMTTVVNLPCGCARMSLWRGVQHMNDVENWTRERIADWIDELHDSGVINAEFEPWNESEESAISTVPDGWQDLGYTTLEENE